MIDAASILANMKAKLQNVDNTGNTWDDHAIVRDYTKTFQQRIAQELEQISNPSFVFVNSGHQHDAFRIYEDITQVNTSLANKMVVEFKEMVDWYER